MNLITSLFAGVMIGWLASIIMETVGREAFIRNVLVGIGGAYAGSWLLGKFFESVNQGGFSFGALFAAIFGAATLLYLMSRLRRA